MCVSQGNPAKPHYNMLKLRAYIERGCYCSSSFPTVSNAHRALDAQKQYKQSHIMESHNKLTLGSGWCSTQLMPVLIRAWKYYLSLAASSKKSILSQVINSALSDCSPIPGSSVSCPAFLPSAYEILFMTCTLMLVHSQKNRCIQCVYSAYRFCCVFLRKNDRKIKQ